MILIICAVHDSAAGAFNRPFFSPSTGLAVRSFRDEVNRNASENTMYSHPSDFSLYNLGQWDDSTGIFTTTAPEVLARAKDLSEVNN